MTAIPARKAAALVLAGIFLTFPAARQSFASAPFRVVIDPGHGGSDTGTVYQNDLIKVAEKDVTLLLAKQVARQLRARGMSVILTRETDQDVPLPARTSLANKMGADVFLSIHMNSTHGSGEGAAEGIETYILNNASDATSHRLAHFENAGLSTEGNTDPRQTDVALILKDLRLDANLSESKRLACAIQGNLTASTSSVSRTGRNRGVKQALFYVLLGADMPSILVEAGFLNSARDRAMALSPQGQKAISGGIADAIDQFRRTKGSSHAVAALSRCKVN